MSQIPLISLLFYGSIFVYCQSPCKNDAPKNCTFYVNYCGWTAAPNEWSTDGSGGMRYMVLQRNANKGFIESELACSTADMISCLELSYRFTKNHVINISVSIIENNDDKANMLWTVNSSENAVDWDKAQVEIRHVHQSAFTVKLEAKKYKNSNEDSVHISSITYFKSPCSQTDRSTTQFMNTNHHSTSQTLQGTTSPGNSASKDTSTPVGVAVAVFVVAVLIAGVAVFVFVLHKRKRLFFWKNCLKNADDKENTDTVTSQNVERSFGEDTQRTVDSVNATPTVSGYENHVFTASELPPLDTYYNAIKDGGGVTDFAVPRDSNMHESKSADCRKLPKESTFAYDDPYEIKAETGSFPLNSAAARNAHPNTNQIKTRRYQNYLAPGDKSQPTSDCSLAKAEGGEATGVYDYPEEGPSNPGEGGETALYEYAKDPDMIEEGNTDASGVYHILERESSESQPVSVYHVPGGKVGQQHTPTVKVSKGQTGNYNTLDFAGNSSGQKNDGGDSGGVYNHLNAGSDDPYNEVDREKRPEVIDDEYSHISSKATVC